MLPPNRTKESMGEDTQQTAAGGDMAADVPVRMTLRFSSEAKAALDWISATRNVPWLKPSDAPLLPRSFCLK